MDVVDAGERQATSGRVTDGAGPGHGRDVGHSPMEVPQDFNTTRLPSNLRQTTHVLVGKHVTKITSFDPSTLQIPRCTQTSQLCLLQNRNYCPLKFYFAGIKNFNS